MKKLSKYLLALIILIAIFARFYKLSSIPVGFNDDEAAFGYNAYSILKTGKDEWGRTLPFPVFESFGDWKLIGYLYPTVLSELIFGKNVFATRLPSAIVGIFAVYATYILTKKLFEEKIALLAAFLLAINPWHIIASRNAFESDILIFFISISIYFFLRSFKESRYLIFSFFGFVFCFYIYRSAWFFLPLFISTIIYFNKKALYRNKIFLFKILTFCGILLLPLIPTILTFSGQSRFIQESFISGVAKQGIINEINEKRGACEEKSPKVICKFTYNKYLSYITIFFNNYFENLSPQTYFTRSPARGYQSFSNRGLLYDFELPLLIAGIVFLIIKKENSAKILLPWILLVPLGASITGVGNPGRLNLILPAPQIIEAFGLFSIVSRLGKNYLKRLVIITVSVTIAFSLIRLWADMFYNYPKISGKYQRYGYQELFNRLQPKLKDYNQIVMSRKNDDAKQYIHYLFFNDISPQKFLDSNYSVRYRGQDMWQVVEKIGNVYFYPSAPDLDTIPPKTLLVTEEHEISYLERPILVVTYPNNDTAFEVYDVDKVKDKIKKLNEK